MAKVTLLPIGDIASAETDINTNFSRIATALENTLSRNGTAPNTMDANLDLNDYRIYNVPLPLTDNEPVPYKMVSSLLTIAEDQLEDVQELIDEAEETLGAAQAVADAAIAEVGTQVDLAERWANEDEDTVVENGEYSAYHWAKKAEDFVAGEIGIDTIPGLREELDARIERGEYQLFYPEDFGGNVAAAVAAAKAAKGGIAFGSNKTYELFETIHIDWDFAYVGCPGGYATLTSMNTDINMIEFGPLEGYETGVTRVFIENLEIIRDHDYDMMTGEWDIREGDGSGIKQSWRTASQVMLSNIRVRFQPQVGIFLQGVDFASIHSCISQQNGLDGFRFLLHNGIGAGQYYWSGTNLAQMNRGSGLVATVEGTVGAGVSMGTITNFHTFANGGFGAYFQGAPTCPIYSVRMMNCFMGGEGATEIYLDTYGSGHTFSNVFIELGMNRGFHFTANNNHVSVRDCNIHQMTNQGILSAANDTLITGCEILGCGINLGTTPDFKYGVHLGGLRNLVVGNRIGNPQGVTTQEFGVYCDTSATGLIRTNNLYNNSVQPVVPQNVAMIADGNIV